MNRGVAQMHKRFLWGGIGMILVGAGLAFLAAEPFLVREVIVSGRSAASPAGIAPLAAAASFALLAGVLLLLFRAYLASSQETVRMLAESASKAREDQEQRMREITQAHSDLVTHHMFTKKMLQCQRSQDVFETLLMGIRVGLGFHESFLGVLDDGGNIVFGRSGNGVGHRGVRIPCWDEGSLLARTVWSGKPRVLPTLEGERHCREDRNILGEGPVFLAPVAKTPGRKCFEVKMCGFSGCPAFSRENARCWIEGFSACVSHHSDIAEEKRKECVRCEMFGSSAVVVTRSHPGSRRINPETTQSIVTLVQEAALALELVEMNENTRRMSITDGLTGLANHREFYQSLGRELERVRRYGHGLSLLMVDVDDFKRVNDRYGHLAGDAALKKIAGLLRGCVRANDIVARYGGEEFGVILPESTPAGALMFAERIKTEIAGHRFLETGDEHARLTVSIGIYSTDNGDLSEERMVRFADEAAYLAKGSGKNCVVVRAHA